MSQGVREVIGSVTGQNVYLAQYAAYQRPSVQDNDRIGGRGSINGSTAVGGGIPPMLSDGMNFALLASNSTGSASRANGRSTAAAQAGSSQGGDLASLLADLQS